MNDPGIEREQYLAHRLRRMRWSATALLAAMAGLFVGASLLVARYPAVGAVRAFAEAALIGGLADWFAVSALFRHPLGLPIPHTAIIPSRKDDIGRALARFVRDHFLVAEAIRVRLDNTDLAARLGSWLEEERNAALVSRDMATALDWLLRSGDGGDSELPATFRASFRAALEQVPISSVFATLIDVLTSGTHAQTLIDQLVQFGRDQLESHRVDIRVRIHDRSPWWMPKMVDQKIYDQLIGEVERIINEIADDPTHPARAEFNARLKSLQHSLIADPDLIARSRGLQDEFIEHPAVRGYAKDLWARLKNDAHESLQDPESALRQSVQREIRNIGTLLKEDAQAAERLNLWLRQFLIYLVETYRDSLSAIISETIDRWDPSATANRIELYIGRDLQFIRINGTLVGGLVGLAIYIFWQTVIL